MSDSACGWELGAAKMDLDNEVAFGSSLAHANRQKLRQIVLFAYFGVFGVNFDFWIFTLYLPNLVYWVGFVTGMTF